MVTKDGRRLDTDTKIEMHLEACPRPCVLSQTGGLKEEGQCKDLRDEKQIQTIRLEIGGFEIGGRARCNRQRKGGVLLRFSRVKIRPPWHQQEFTRGFVSFWVNPVILGLYVSGLFDKEGMLFPEK